MSPVFITEFFPAYQRRKLIPADPKAAQGMSLKGLDILAKYITQFNPNSTEGHNIQGYLWDIDSCDWQRPVIPPQIHIQPRATKIPRRKSVHIKSNYQLLCETLIKEFTGPESEHGLLITLEIKQGQQETPQAYYNRFRQAHLGAHNEPELDEA